MKRFGYVTYGLASFVTLALIGLATVLICFLVVFVLAILMSLAYDYWPWVALAPVVLAGLAAIGWFTTYVLDKTTE